MALSALEESKRSHKGRFSNYHSLPDILWESIIPDHFGLSGLVVSNEEMVQSMKDVALVYSKGRGKKANEEWAEDSSKVRLASKLGLFFYIDDAALSWSVISDSHPSLEYSDPRYPLRGMVRNKPQPFRKYGMQPICLWVIHLLDWRNYPTYQFRQANAVSGMPLEEYFDFV